MKIRPANEQDLAELSGWFLTESEAKNWGGPSIHFPLSLEQLKLISNGMSLNLMLWLTKAIICLVLLKLLISLATNT